MNDYFIGLGGTCVNVGCIPKKLMHQAALLGIKCCTNVLDIKCNSIRHVVKTAHI